MFSLNYRSKGNICGNSVWNLWFWKQA